MLGAAVVGAPAHATIVVNSASSGRDVPGVCTLRDALAAVNSGAPSGGCPAGQAEETIVLQVPAPIVYSTADDDSDNAALPPINDGRFVTILGNRAVIERDAGLPCQANGVTEPGELRLFEVHGRLDLFQLDLGNGCADGANLSPRALGGTIYSDGWVELDEVGIQSGRARSLGGAIYSAPSAYLRVVRSTLVLNFANGAGGAIHAERGVVEIERSLFTQNVILTDPQGSVAPAGAAIHNRGGSLRVVNSTFSGCVDATPSSGGGIVAASDYAAPSSPSSTLLAFTTIAGNNGIGVRGSTRSTHGFANTIVASNSAGQCAGIATARDVHYGRNIYSDTTCIDDFDEGDLHATDPQLGALGANGGPTWTRPPLPGSPAIDGSTNCIDAAAPVTIDQIGRPRPLGAACDVGAVETLPEVIFAAGFES